MTRKNPGTFQEYVHRDAGHDKPAVSNPAKNPDTISTRSLTTDTLSEVSGYKDRRDQEGYQSMNV